MQQTEKYWNLIHRVVLVAIFVMALVGVVLAFTPKVAQMQGYQLIKEDLQDKIELNVSSEKLLRQQHDRFRTDPSFVEKIAHEVGYARKDEVIFQFPDSNAETNGFSY